MKNEQLRMSEVSKYNGLATRLDCGRWHWYLL